MKNEKKNEIEPFSTREIVVNSAIIGFGIGLVIATASIVLDVYSGSPKTKKEKIYDAIS